MITVFRNGFILLLMSSLLFVSCSRDDDDFEDLDSVVPEEISGTISAPTVLENRFNNPAAVDYVITRTLILNANLTIEPGVRIQVSAGQAIDVRAEGSLTAEGTADNPIIIEGVQQTRGFWSYLRFFDSNNPANRLIHCKISDAGSSSSQNAIVFIRGNSLVIVQDTEIRNSQTNGLVLANANSRLSEFRNNLFAQCDLYPMSIHNITHATFIDEETDIEENNSFNVIRVGNGTLTTPGEIKKTKIPFVFNGSNLIEADLTVAPGAQLRMGPGAALDVRQEGSLSMIGTPNEKITVTGDVETPGYFNYIRFFSSNNPRNEFQYVDVLYGGGSTSNNANIYLRNGASLSMSHSRVANSASWGLRAVSNSTYDDQGNNIFENNAEGDIDAN